MTSSTAARFVLALSLVFTSISAQQTPPLTPDIPSRFEAPTSAYDYVKRDVMIPMRDNVKLHTVIIVPKDARHAPREALRPVGCPFRSAWSR